MSLHYPETLFSFEVLVDYIKFERHCEVSEKLAVAVRLLDFPTLLIYPRPRTRGGGGRAERAFNRGKSCLFKISLTSLHVHLSSSPLYAMVLDAAEKTPRLVGSCAISLAKAVDRIWQDVAGCGIAHPSSHTERELVSVCNLTGERVGKLSLSYKLVCLGASLLPHIAERRGDGSTRVAGGERQEHVEEKPKLGESLPLSRGSSCPPSFDKPDLNVQTSGRADSEMLSNKDIQDDDVESDASQSRAGDHFEADLTSFCPPCLYYSNTAKEKSQYEELDYKLLNLDMEAFTFEDLPSENQANIKEVKGPSSQVVHKKGTLHPNTPGSQETSKVTPDVLREALQQLPLLNALVAELSQLNGQRPDQYLAVHPSQARTCRPSSSEPLAGPGNIAHPGETPVPLKTAHLKRLQHPRNCSTPIINPRSANKKDGQNETLTGNKFPSKFRRKNLVYGTTRTFDLRRKLISPVNGKHCECMGMVQRETLPRTAKGKTMSSRKPKASSKSKSVYNRISNQNKNIETVIQSFTADAEPQDATTLKQKTQQEKVHVEPGVSLKVCLSQRDLKCIRIPSVGIDSIPQSKDEQEHHSRSDPAESESDGDGNQSKSSQSSRRSGLKSSYSESSIEGNEEADYMDDFDSLEYSDAFSPDPLSSPETSGAKTPKSPVHLDLCNSDSTFLNIHKRKALLPEPVKAPSSPHRALMGTYIVRPRVHTSALSFSSDDDDRERQASFQTVCSRKQTAASSKLGKDSSGESFVSSSAQKAESAENCDPVRRCSAESISSLGAQEGEELEDELGSLDFRKEYKHITELVANKLPGYTM
ncbi:microtubule-associated protein 10 [Xenentodon cancila]